MSKILVVDDDKEIVKAIGIYLTRENYEFVVAYDGVMALEKLSNQEVDLVILDIMMPKMNGIEVLNKIRQTSQIPVILLSAKSEDYDKVEGLNVGADDYITKPFNPMELVARVNSQLRRYNNFYKDIESEKVYRSGDLLVDDIRKVVRVFDKEIKLTPTQYNILLFLICNKGKVFSMEQIYASSCASESFDVANVVAVHIRHIREKIELDPKKPKYVKVVWGVGYKVEDIEDKV